MAEPTPEVIRAGTVNLERLKAWKPRRDQVIAEVNSMNLDLIGFQECTEEMEADLDAKLNGDWIVVSDKVNCPAFIRADRFERIEWNGKAAIGMTLPGSVRPRYGSAAYLRRKSDGLLFTFATIHPSNNGESSTTQAGKDRVRQAEACWTYFEQWGVTDQPILLVGDTNDRNMPPNGLPGVFVSHGMTDVLQALKQKPRIDRAFLLGFRPISATVNNVAAAASDHDFGVFVVAPIPPAPEVRLHGVDVSSYQPNWTPTASDAFVFVKATEGTGYQNPARADQLANGRAAGLQIGHYHYLLPNNAVPQARYFVEHADIHAGDLLACDWEGIWKTGGHPSVEDAAQFIAEVKRLLPENRCGLYCNTSDWNSTTVKAGDFLWIAEYGTKAPNIKAAWDFWQFNNAPIDMNLSRFETLDELKAWAHVTEPPVKPPVLKPPTVEPPELPPVPPVSTTVKHSAKWGADYLSWKGEGWVTVKDHAILTILDRESDPFWKGIHLTQGGLSTSVAASANTHAGLGCFDVRTKFNSKEEVWELASMFLRSGMVFFPRGYTNDSFQNVKHGHVVSRESWSSLHPSAQAQYREYMSGGDGLVGPKAYTGPSTPFERWSTSPYNPDNVTRDDQTYMVDVSDGFLWGLDVDRKKVTQKATGTLIDTDCRIKRWGRINAVTAEDIFYALEYLSIPEVTP